MQTEEMFTIASVDSIRDVFGDGRSPDQQMNDIALADISCCCCTPCCCAAAMESPSH